MRNSTGLWLIVIAALLVLALFMVVFNPTLGDKKIGPHLGLDIQGGLRVLLAADNADVVDFSKMDQARQIVDRRVNALGVVEPVVQVSGGNRILVELPGITNPQTAIDTVKQTGLLEFVDFSQTGTCSASMPGAGQYILTDKQVALRGVAPAGTAAATSAATAAGTKAATAAGTSAATAAAPVAGTAAVTAAATTTVPPTATPAATATTVPPTATSVPPTATSVPPTATSVPPTTQPTATTPPAATAVATAAATGELDNLAARPLLKMVQGTAAATDQSTPAATPQAATAQAATAAATSAATAGATAAATPQATVSALGDGSKDHPALNPCTNTPFSTVMTGAGLQTADAGVGSTGTDYVVNFTLASNDEATNFGTFTSTHIEKPMAIVLDGQVLSAPTIKAALTTGGQITGGFTRDKANELALQLRYGALPVSLHVESIEQVGASLGAESIQASVRAGLIGILVVLIFMLVYYRIPGAAADLALLLFAVINFALYEFIPITLTLPAIIGFMISVGTAVDGNILIFERIKEEIRAGRTGERALDLGFARAWPSIRDSNISTIVVALIIYFFGGQFGAGAVRGFALTLILGLLINLFTAVIVTHTFMNLIMGIVGPALRQTGLFTGVRKVEE